MILLFFFYRSRDFRSSYGRLHELRALVPKGTPLLACTATVTHGIRKEVIESLEMTDCETVTTSPDRPNIYYEVRVRTDMETDLNDVVASLKELKNMAPRVIVYCRTLDICVPIFTLSWVMGLIILLELKQLVIIAFLVCFMPTHLSTTRMLF